MQKFNIRGGAVGAGAAPDADGSSPYPEDEACFQYCIDVTMYDTKPTHSLDLARLETIMTQRLALLHRVHYLMEMGSDDLQIDRDTAIKIISDEERKRGLGVVPAATRENERDDRISHWMLLLSLCRSEDLQRFFLNQETRLFRTRMARLRNENPQYYSQKLRDYAESRFDHPEPGLVTFSTAFMKFQEDQGKKARIRKEWYPLARCEDFYAVPHTQTLIFQDRSIQMAKGYALVPLYKMEGMLINEFREKISKKLELAHKHFPEVVATDPRMKELLLRMNDQYTGPDYSEHESRAESGIRVSLAALPEIANSPAYPPCMKVLHTKLTQASHLRHFGRLQYGLFLKGAGLSLRDSVDFWKGHFTRKISFEKFEKDYLYNIRHAYGQEGKRVDYTPWTCSTILHRDPPVSANEHHGCPFKNYDAPQLVNLLEAYPLSKENVSNILKLKVGKEHQRACLNLFRAAHPNATPDNVGNTPNSFLTSALEANKPA